MKLTDYLDESVTIDGKDYKIDMAFDNILRFYELYEDKEVNEFEKLEYMFEMLVEECKTIDISPVFKKEVIEQVMAQYVMSENKYSKVDQEEQDDPSEAQDEETETREYDLIIDAELIFSSFVYDYKIDLFEEQGKLHWKKFTALLNGLSEGSPLMKVINIRTCKVPVPNKYNAAEIAQIRKLKRKYSLEDSSKQNMQSGLSKAATFLRSKSKTKVGDKK